MSILSTNQKLIKVGQDYSAGSGISIDDGVISVTGEFGKTYSAGDNVDIYEQDEQLYISSKDWTNDIANASANAYNEAVAQIPDPFDPSYLSAQIDNKLNSSEFTDWQNGQYTTDLQTIEGKINNKLDTSSFSDVSASFLTAINIPESATWNEVSQAYEQASGTYLTSVSIPESATWQDVSTTVQSNSAQWAEGGGGGDPEVNSFVYDNSATIVDVDTTYQQNSASYLTSHQDISYKLDTTAFSTVSGDFLTAAPADMATTGDVAELAQTVSETYQTKGDYLVRSDSANFYPANNPSSFVNEDWVTAQGYITGVDLSEYAKRDFVLSSVESATSGKLDVSSFASVSSDFLTTSFGISESAHWEEATNAYEQNSGTYLTAVDLSPYQTIEGMTAYQPAGSYATTNELEQVSADITATIPSTAGLASESYVQTNSAVLTGMIDGKQDTLTFGYDEQDRINSINSSALAGGGDVPEDVMVESAIGYNAVGEISAYGNSAIAQYGAEKQWLVHDDTLVHAANSAQYALGVNLSAVAQLLGVDETVLWSGSKNTTAGTESLSDNMWNYDKLDFYLTFDTASSPQRAQCISRYYVGNHTTAQPLYVYLTANNIASNTLTAEVMYFSGTPDGNNFGLLGGIRRVNSTVSTGITSYNCKLVEIRGIGRKQ